MSSITIRLQRLTRELQRQTHLDVCDQGRLTQRFSGNFRLGIAKPSDLHGVTFERERYQRYLVGEADAYRAAIDEGEQPTLFNYVAWCVRLLLVPPSQTVPDFLLEAFQVEFEDAWRQPWKDEARHDNYRHGAQARCHLVDALGTPDGARFRHRFASGDFDGPPPWPDGWGAYDLGIDIVRPPAHFPYVGWDGEPLEPAAPVQIVEGPVQHDAGATSSNRPAPGHFAQIDWSWIV